VFDAVLPKLDAGDDVALLRYYAGVSHAETGDIESAIEYLTAFLADADPGDALHRDATYQLGMMLPTVGRADEGLRYLEGLRPVLAAEYGSDSIHVKALERRIAQIRTEITGAGHRSAHPRRRGVSPGSHR
jgi:hypothetical protein